MKIFLVLVLLIIGTSATATQITCNDGQLVFNYEQGKIIYNDFQYSAYLQSGFYPNGFETDETVKFSLDPSPKEIYFIFPTSVLENNGPKTFEGNVLYYDDNKGLTLACSRD